MFNKILTVTIVSLYLAACSGQKAPVRTKPNQGNGSDDGTGNGSDEGSGNGTGTSALLQQIKLDLSSVKIPAGFDVVYTATGQYSDATSKDISDKVTISISDESIATVIKAEKKIRGLKIGKLIISVSDGDIIAKGDIEFTLATLTSVDIAPKNVKMPAGGQGQIFKLNGTFSDGTAADISSQAQWTSSNLTPSAQVTADVNNLDKKGFARGLNEGASLISATFESKTASTNFEVPLCQKG